MSWVYISDLDAFELYHKVRSEEDDSTGSKAVASAATTVIPALRQACAGAAGTALSNVVVYPLDLVVTRLKVQHRLKGKSSTKSNDNQDTQYNGILDASTKIYANEGGLPAFYGGVLQDTFKSVTDAFLFFLAYNVLRRARQRSGQSQYAFLRVLDQLSIGVAAGAFSKLITTPIQIIVTRKQITAIASARQSKDDIPHKLGRNLSVQQIMHDVYDKYGLAGFWSGYSATLFLTLNPSITFSLDSLIRKLLRTGKTPAPALTFLIAATAKATASALLYPLSLAKSRAQASGASSEEVKDDDETKGRRKSSGRTDILSTLMHMADSEGIGALYAGVSGEVMKGFLAHGITMLVQQRIQPLAIRLYYLLAKLLRMKS